MLIREQSGITARQFMIFVFFFTIGNTFIDEPGELTVHAGREGWIAGLVATFLAVGLAWFWMAIQKRLGEMNLIEANEFFFGKVIGKAISFLFFLYFMLNFIYTCYIFIDFTELNLLPSASRVVLGGLFVFVVLSTVRKGLTNIARISEFFFPLVVVFLEVFFVLVLPAADFRFPQPILENGIGPITKGVISTTSPPFFELITLLLIYASVPISQRENKYFYTGILSGGFVLVILTLLSVAVLGTGQVAQTIYPSFALAKSINLVEFANRIESLVSISWLISQVIYGALSFYAALYTLAKILNLTSYRILTFPLALISLAYSPYLMERRVLLNLDIWFWYSLLFAILLPLGLFITALFRKEKFT